MEKIGFEGVIATDYSRETQNGQSVELKGGMFILGLVVGSGENQHVIDVVEGSSVIMYRVTDDIFGYSVINGKQWSHGTEPVTALKVSTIDDAIQIPVDVNYITAPGKNLGGTDWTGYHPKGYGNWVEVDQRYFHSQS